MEKKKLAAFSAVGLAAAIAVPAIAFGNARNNVGGSGHAVQAANTPLVGLMNGPNDLATSGTPTPTGDPDGTGTAAFTFDITDPLDTVAGAQVCWDLSYSNLTGTPIAAHIHRGAAGVGGPVVIIPPTLPNLTATGTTGCTVIAGTLATEVVTTPANFYINVHTTDFPAGAIRSQLSTGPIPAGEAHLLPAPLRAYDSRDADGPIALNATRTISLAAGKDSTGDQRHRSPGRSHGSDRHVDGHRHRWHADHWWLLEALQRQRSRRRRRPAASTGWLPAEPGCHHSGCC